MSAEFFSYVDAHKAEWVASLAEAVAIQSVSSDPKRRGDVFRQMEVVRDKIIALGGSAELHANPLGIQQFPDGEVPLPPLLTGLYPAVAVAGKKTVLVYGHLDVQPASVSDGWDTDPFTLVEKDGKLYGRGSTDDKGPVLAWLHVITSYQALGKELPVNLRFILEGMEESGSLRGLVYFMVSVKCARADMHSGVYGGSVHEAMWDVVKLMGSLNAPDGTIAVPGVMEAVDPMTDAERALYAGIEFDAAAFAAQTGVPNRLRFSDKEGILTARWRYPTLSLHGIEGAWSGAGAKTVIPKEVIGKFSLRLVPSQVPEQVEAAVRAHLARVWEGLGSPNEMSVAMEHGAAAWVSPVDSPNYMAARRAVEAVFGVAPDLTREGGSIPITLTLEKATGGSVLLLPIGGCDDGAHSTNEKINVSNYVNGIKVLGTYLEEFAKL